MTPPDFCRAALTRLVENLPFKRNRGQDTVKCTLPVSGDNNHLVPEVIGITDFPLIRQWK